MSTRIWHNLPPQYRAAADPEALVTVWRGDFIGREVTGISCNLESTLDPEEVVYNSLFAKYPDIRTLVRRHCQSNDNSPFISLTGQIDLAEQFANGPSETVYEIVLPTHQLVADPPRGNDSPHVEILAIGAIKPADIVAIRCGNNPVEWDRSMSWLR